MFYLKYFAKEAHYLLQDHKSTRFIIFEGSRLFLCLLSGLVFALGFRMFVSLPDDVYLNATQNGEFVIKTIVTGGMSGISQCFIQFLALFGIHLEYNTLQSIFYATLNIPILIFAFCKLGIKFSIFTTINVLCTSLFINFLPTDSIFDEVSALLANENLARAIFAGIMTGISSGLAFKANHSSGGLDTIAYYLSSRKSVATGKYMVILNGTIMIIFTILSIANGTNTAVALSTILFSIVYLFASSLMVDAINVRNKKVQLQIVTPNEALARIIVTNVPHSCTIVKAKGGYTGNDKYIIYVVVSNSEVTKLVNQIRKVDPNSFISTNSLRQVYGRFFIKPLD